MPERLVDRFPVVSPAALVDALVPPPLFAGARFDTYLPDPEHPTQAVAKSAAASFADDLAAPPRRTLFARRPQPFGGNGIYFDGGFGVGKTHLLASLWHAAPAPKAYATFVELTHLVGALGFAETVGRLSGMHLLAIDEFELDDPGDTVLVASLLGQLAGAGVGLAATSNTLPDRLGDGRFATEDFLREIQQLAARFTAVRVDGPDYRHRGLPDAPEPVPAAAVRALADATPGASLDDFGDLLAHLASLHPSRYGALLDDVSAVHLTDVTPAPDQAAALRLVVLVDRLYDRQLPVIASGTRLDRVFDDDMLSGGFRKKYRRAVSRLVALSRAERPPSRSGA